MEQKRLRQLFSALLITLFVATSSFAGDLSILAVKKGTQVGCPQKQTAVQMFPSSEISTNQTYSTVYICMEGACNDIAVVFGGVPHDSYLGCSNILSYEGVAPGEYDFYGESYECNTFWEYTLLVEEGYDYTIWLCPPDGVQCCDAGCGDGGSYNCESCGGCFAGFVTQDKTVLNNLRKFREDVLAKNLIGQKIITLYYKWSPAAINFAKKNPIIKAMSKKIIEQIGSK